MLSILVTTSINRLPGFSIVSKAYRIRFLMKGDNGTNEMYAVWGRGGLKLFSKYIQFFLHPKKTREGVLIFHSLQI